MITDHQSYKNAEKICFCVNNFIFAVVFVLLANSDYSIVELYVVFSTNITMVSMSTLIKCIIVLTLFIFCQIHSAKKVDNNYELNDIDLGDDLYETLPIQHHRLLHHQDFRRASLRYHPHVLYKKASLRPIIGHNDKITFTKRDRVRRYLSSLIN
ncbi:unnamed protein product [Rotaria sordida]|uniref:Uncharacterized protein n=1 Tax=Rotaria sordida TaxID=392033 RepID=A0A814A6B4_9BILA|nr:unnamed protein product [Rotaria sordida]